MKFSNTTRFFVGLVAACSMFVLYQAAMQRTAVDLPRFLCLYAVAVVASRFKVSIPGLNGSMSMTLPFILIAFAELSFLEALMIACGSTLIQSLGGSPNRPKPIQVLFNVCNVANAIGLVHFATKQGPEHFTFPVSALIMTVAASVYFFSNTVSVAAVIALAEKKNMLELWKNVFMWSFPYYVISAGLASMFTGADHMFGWQVPMALLPVTYFLYRSFRMYFGQPRPAAAMVFAAQAQAVSGDD